jgi:predicted NUDIX family NTP pyrophosphohydrolase
MINRLNSKKFQKSNAKPKIIKDQQTLIDRLEKELEVSSIKEVNVKEQINDIEEKM